jgi:hypothetical protein
MRQLYTLLLFFISFSLFATNSVELLRSDGGTVVVRFDMNNYNLEKVQTSSGLLDKIVAPGSVPLMKKGAPAVPVFYKSVIIDDLSNTQIEVISSNFIDIPNIDLVPSKGNLYRTIDPSAVAYSYGSEYTTDAFYPTSPVASRDPYVLRDFRAQTILFQPFQYNAYTHTLRVYRTMTVKLSSAPGIAINPLERSKELTSIDQEFYQIYKRQFLNFDIASRYTPLVEQGRLLIICKDTYMAAMEPYVNWKKQLGIPTELIDVATAGYTAEAIKTYINDYYSSNSLTYLLLVGDAEDVPPVSYPTGASDNAYGYLQGIDSYPELFVGRFSANTVAHVTTQVQKVIQYEKLATTTETFYKTTIGIGSDQGPGDDDEMDFEHIRGLQALHTSYTYNTNKELFDGSQGAPDMTGDPNASMLATMLNQGAGIMNYSGHGDWYCSVTTGFSNTNIDNLVNYNKLPFFFSVACVNGEFMNATCYAEKWLRATKNGQLTGAIATLMATINQSWNPPMEGQDEMNAILVESYSGNIKRTFAGISMNGCMQMNDAYGAAGDEMTDTWVCFGDPTLVVRTDVPAVLTATHVTTENLGVSSLNVACNTEGATIALTMNNEIIGTGVVQNGSATIPFAAINSPALINVTASAYNKIPYTGIVNIGTAVGIEQSVIEVLNCYPNPAKDQLTIFASLTEASKLTYEFRSVDGRTIEKRSTISFERGNNSLQIELSDIPAGFYILEMSSGNSTFTKKIVVTH